MSEELATQPSERPKGRATRMGAEVNAWCPMEWAWMANESGRRSKTV